MFSLIRLDSIKYTYTYSYLLSLFLESTEAESYAQVIPIHTVWNVGLSDVVFDDAVCCWFEKVKFIA